MESENPNSGPWYHVVHRWLNGTTKNRQGSLGPTPRILWTTAGRRGQQQGLTCEVEARPGEPTKKLLPI